MIGPTAVFRGGQWEAIRLIAEARSRALVVQKTGWGKSLVYFIATRILREGGAGPTLLISPLLSLMRNQLEMAARIGIRAASVNSANADEWAATEHQLRNGECDLLLVSPERLANDRFLTTTLPTIRGGIGLFVVDEAHCISDWGHDFRPDYRRIVRIVRMLPVGVPILATTATANDRVVADIVEQLGPGLRVLRGSLARPTVRLQVIRLADQAERLAWLAQYLPTLPGSGIAYCLTVADCERVAAWLVGRGIDARAYYAKVPGPERVALEQRLIRNGVKVLVATVALGMGFDKPDLGFVVHFQRPGSLVAYYQQIGRAGRAVDEAFAILLNGREDDEIQEYFIQSAFPGVDRMGQVLGALEEFGPLSVNELLSRVNLARGRVEQSLKLLEVDGAVARDGSRYYRTVNPWAPDVERSERVIELRRRELDRIRAFVDSPGCLMEFVRRELDDPGACPCGRCAVCAGSILPSEVDAGLVREAISFLKRDARRIEPRRQWPVELVPGRSGRIGADIMNAEGRALCIYGDAGWGRTVAAGKYRDGHFGDALVQASAELIRTRWTPRPIPRWVTAVPSLRHPRLVPDFAARLAAALGLPYRVALEKVRETPEQKSMKNSALQAANVVTAFQAVRSRVLPGPVLLVDDIVDSRWTFTVCGVLLREAGSGPVHPLALASSAGTRDVP